MYIPNYFLETNNKTIFDFIKEFSFATLITNSQNKCFATQTPLIIIEDLEGKSIIIGHIAKRNEQSESILNGSEALCLFQGPHCYISPTWYSTPNVPTWNYKSVQIKGTFKILNDLESKNTMSILVKNFETDIDKPFNLKDIPYEILNEDLKEIIVFKIEISEIKAAFKLSQNRDEKSYFNIIKQLKKQDDMNSLLIAFEMENEFKKKIRVG